MDVAPALLFSLVLSSALVAVQGLKMVVLYILSSFHSGLWLH